MARMDKMFPVENKPKRVRTGRPSEKALALYE